MKVNPKKHLGQHFLNDINIAKKIVDSLSVNNAQTLIEIGPGTGVLTKFLFDKHFKYFYVYEVDYESIYFLEDKFPELSEHIINESFIKANITQKFITPIAVIGNLPYNISGRILFKIVENHSIISEMVCMVQKEVAERYVAMPGNKTYGILSVLIQTFYDIEYLFTVNQGVFFPPPKVKSAVVRLTRKDNFVLGCKEKLFFSVVKTAFGQRRKTMRNSLKSLICEEIKANEIFSKRPEQLGFSDFIILTKLIETCNIK